MSQTATLLITVICLLTLPFYSHCSFLFFFSIAIVTISCLVHPLPGFYYIFAISCLCLIWCLHVSFIAALEHPLPQSTPLSTKCCHSPCLLPLWSFFPDHTGPHISSCHLLLLFAFKLLFRNLSQ